MAIDAEPGRGLPNEWQPSTDFLDRLSVSLADADRERQRQALLRRITRLVPLALILGTLLAWHLTFTGPNGVHLVIHTLTWLALILDTGVNIDSSLLTYLGMQTLPTIVGALLFVLVTVTLLWEQKDPE